MIGLDDSVGKLSGKILPGKLIRLAEGDVDRTKNVPLTLAETRQQILLIPNSVSFNPPPTSWPAGTVSRFC